MIRLSLKDNGRLSARKVSALALYASLALSAVVFGAFYLVGFDVPFDDDPSFNAPLLTDALLWLVWVLVVATAVLSVYSLCSGLRRGKGLSAVVNGVPVARIAVGVVAIVACCLMVTFMLGSPEPITANGAVYADSFWLRVSDMLIDTVLITLVATACLVVVSLAANGRMTRKRRQG